MRTLLSRIHSLGHDQKGAIAILCLAGALILVMMGLLVLDAAEVANDKVHVQASADAAAHTQASVMARTMNMTAFANVGKRINVGYIAAYDTMFRWLRWLRNAGFILTAAICLGALVPALSAVLGPLCKQVAMITGGALCAWERERHDHDKLAKVVGATFGPEVRGFNNYQQYMQDIAPFWAWSKGVMSGFENQAPLTVGYPMPGPEDSSRPRAKLPMRAETNHKWDDMCDKANRVDAVRAGSMDRWMMLGDFTIKNVWEVLDLNSFIGGMVKDAMGKAFSGDTEGGQDLFEVPNQEPDAGQGGGGGGSGKKDLDCNMMKEISKNLYENLKVDVGNDCSKSNDPDCKPRPAKVSMDGKDITVDENCVPIGEDAHLADTLITLSGVTGKDCTDLMKTNQLKAGYYGAIFLSGFLALTINVDKNSGEEVSPIAKAMAKLVKSAVPTFRKSCSELTGGPYAAYSKEGHAWILDTSDWLTDSSAMIFAYRPSSIRNTQMRDNYFFGDGVNPAVLAQKSHGAWGMSRGEITWQGEHEIGPSLWESKWGARVRPVALANEWNQGQSMGDAAESMEKVMLNILRTVHIDDPAMAGRGRYDTMGMLLNMSMDLSQDIKTGFGGFQPDHMQGVNK